jgi:hypothetical protein
MNITSALNRFICVSLSLIFSVFISCKKEKELILPDNIMAGQKDATGIYYFDFEPDIKCYVFNPWIKQDTAINLDLNKDGVDDFTFYREICHPGYLGGDCDRITIILAGYNEICVIPAPFPDAVIEPCMHSRLDWADTLSVSDIISRNNIWSNKESLIYSYSWNMNTCSIKEGFWSDVVPENNKYIGFKIVKDGKDYYGWIGFTNFTITDYAITQEYEK